MIHHSRLQRRPRTLGCVWKVKAPDESVEAKSTLHLFAPSLLAVKLRVPFTSMLSKVPSRVSC